MFHFNEMSLSKQEVQSVEAAFNNIKLLQDSAEGFNKLQSVFIISVD